MSLTIRYQFWVARKAFQFFKRFKKAQCLVSLLALLLIREPNYQCAHIHMIDLTYAVRTLHAAECHHWMSSLASAFFTSCSSRWSWKCFMECSTERQVGCMKLTDVYSLLHLCQCRQWLWRLSWLKCVGRSSFALVVASYTVGLLSLWWWS